VIKDALPGTASPHIQALEQMLHGKFGGRILNNLEGSLI